MNTQSDIREQAMSLPRIDTHTHFDGNLPDLRDIAAGFENAAEKGELINSRICAEGCRELYSIRSRRAPTGRNSRNALMRLILHASLQTGTKGANSGKRPGLVHT